MINRHEFEPTPEIVKARKPGVRQSRGWQRVSHALSNWTIATKIKSDWVRGDPEFYDCGLLKQHGEIQRHRHTERTMWSRRQRHGVSPSQEKLGTAEAASRSYKKARRAPPSRAFRECWPCRQLIQVSSAPELWENKTSTLLSHHVCSDLLSRKSIHLQCDLFPSSSFKWHY